MQEQRLGFRQRRETLELAGWLAWTEQRVLERETKLRQNNIELRVVVAVREEPVK